MGRISLRIRCGVDLIFLSPGKKVTKNNFFPEARIKKILKPLDAPCRELFGGGFGIPIGRLVAWVIDSPPTAHRAQIQLYSKTKMVENETIETPYRPAQC